MLKFIKKYLLNIKHILLLATLLSLSCSTLQKGRVDPEFKPFVEEFVEKSRNYYSEQKIRRISIQFFENNGDAVGVAYVGLDRIKIKKSYWQKATYLQKRQLMWHELGHILGRSHTDDPKQVSKDFFYFTPIQFPGYLSDSCPNSMMHSYVFSDYCLQKHNAYYEAEMMERTAPEFD